MESEIKLSILIPSIPERLHLVAPLLVGYSLDGIEVLSLADNKSMSIGDKRNRLLSVAQGKYVMFSDDDDQLFINHIPLLLSACEKDVDVITFLQAATVDGNKTLVDFDLTHTENEVFVTDGITKRMPFHVCAWKRELVKGIKFPHKNWGEDWAWCEKAIKKAKTQYKIEEVIHIYTHDKNISRAYAD